MPQHGDKLYRCFNGTLEEASFIGESLADGDSVTTYVLREGGRDIRVSKDMYKTNKATAYQSYLDSVLEAIPRVETTIVETQNHLQFLRDEVVRIKKKLSNL